MPPTATTPTFSTSAAYPTVQGPASGTTTNPAAAAMPVQLSPTGQSPVLMSPIQFVAVPQGAVQMTDGWTTYMPVTAAPGPMICFPFDLQQQQQHQHPSPGHPTTVIMEGPVSHFHPVNSSPPPNQMHFNPLANSKNMELVWHDIFNRLFSQFHPYHWILEPVDAIPKGNYRIFNDSAKVRFLCQRCGNAWTSMKGRVVFAFRFDYDQNTGMVHFKLFGQKCQKCMPETFEHAMWYPEEVHKVVTNVFNAVGRALYGVAEAPVYRERRKGKPRTQHNSSLCQACAAHACMEGNFERSLTIG